MTSDRSGIWSTDIPVKKISFNPAANEYDINNQSYQKMFGIQNHEKSAYKIPNSDQVLICVHHVRDWWCTEQEERMF